MTFNDLYAGNPINGNADFSGNGPEMQTNISTIIIDNKIISEIFFEVRETTPDWTTGNGEWEKVLYTAPSGYEILSFYPSAGTNLGHIDQDHDSSCSDIELNEAVRRICYDGDGPGDDIGPNCGSTCANLNVFYNELTVRIRKF